MKNTDLYSIERDTDFDIKEDEALEFSKRYSHLAGCIDFFKAECPLCECSMPFELDEGVCMHCGCDPVEGVLEYMTDVEIEKLLENNIYHLRLPYLRRKPFETLVELLERQVVYRCEEALKMIKE